jgi:2'-5' RNA ligase
LFIGVELDEVQRAFCAQSRIGLERRLDGLRGFDVRWIADENLHITVWFLGEVKEDVAARVIEVLRAPWVIEPFDMSIAGAGAFPPSGALRILWFGVSDGAEALTRTYAELAIRLAPLGYEAERRPYHPHVTVGRVKNADRVASRKARDVLREWAFDGGSRRVAAVTLFRSHLSPRGSRYEPLLRVPLKGC